MYSIASHIQKGGVGKTTLVGNLGYELSYNDKNILLVDLDHSQGNLTTWLLEDSREVNYEVLDVLKGDISLSKAIQKVRDGLYILPSFGSSNAFTKWIKSEFPDPENIDSIKELLNDCEKLGFDFVLFDMSPAFTHFEQQVHLAINEIIPTINADAFAIDGIDILKEKLKGVAKSRERNNLPQIKLNKIIINKVNNSFNLDKEIIKNFPSNDSYKFYSVSQNQKIKETQIKNSFIFEEKKENHIKEEYKAIANSLLMEAN